MKNLLACMILGVTVWAGCAALDAQEAADTVVTAAELASCRTRGEHADAGQHITTYNECMQEAGLR
jgi:hypothetical protein